MTVPEYIARQTERVGEALAHFIATTPEDRLVWHPAVEGGAPTRSILEQAAECVSVNRRIAALLRGATEQSGTPPAVKFANGQDAQEQVVISARELAAAIGSMTEADLSRSYEHPRGQMSGENIIIMPLRNMAYHAGQANFIQILYGDTEFHVPPTWR
ncbi:MAG TPA: DinB family protein [Chthonomonadaceae bacterium]|nr:DinB family protein [Chthonomonadaceae bacterium]